MNIKKVLIGSFGYLVQFRGKLAKALIIPLLILVFTAVYPLMATSESWYILVGILEGLAYTLLAINIHRILLIGEHSVPAWGEVLPTWRVFRFIGYSVLVTLAVVPVAFAALIPVIGIPISIFGMFYILSRLSLIFPAIVTDQNLNLSGAWKASENHQMLMLFVVAIFPLVLAIPEFFLPNSAEIQVFIAILSAFTVIWVVSALSVAFKLVSESWETNVE